jgi:hypothetical protein
MARESLQIVVVPPEQPLQQYLQLVEVNTIQLFDVVLYHQMRTAVLSASLVNNEELNQKLNLTG